MAKRLRISAFIVGKTHLDYLITAALRYGRPHGFYWWEGDIRHRLTDDDSADQVGQVLAAENRRSVNARYSQDEPEMLYTFTRYPGSGDRGSAGRPQIEAVQVLKAIQCYCYQSCEHPEWPTSSAHGFMEALRLSAIHHLPGYEDAAWEIPPVQMEARR